MFTIYVFFPNVLASLYNPILEPIQSISEFECPIIITFSASKINSLSACATVLAFTLVLFSTSCALPPKNTYFPLSLTTAWSPPRPKTISNPACADLYFS